MVKDYLAATIAAAAKPSPRHLPMLLAAAAVTLWPVVNAQLPMCNLTTFQDTSCTHPAFAWTNASTFEQCCADCAAKPGCMACEWMGSRSGAPKDCHLKAAPGQKIAQEGTICGVSKSLPPVATRWTPCSYSLLHNSQVASTLHLSATKNQIYSAQTACDALGDACGGWSVVDAVAVLVAPFTQRDVVAAPTGSLLYSKHCGPWEDPPEVPTIWPIPAEVAVGNKSVALAPDFTMQLTGPPSKLLSRAIARYDSLIFAHPTVEERNQSSAGLQLTQLLLIIANKSEELFLGVDENYTLSVPSSCPVESTRVGASCAAVLHAPTVFGALRGLESFSQVVRFDYESELYYVPGAPLVISDMPRFGYRGIMLDVARHFMPVAVIRQTIDALAFAKFNSEYGVQRTLCACTHRDTEISCLVQSCTSTFPTHQVSPTFQNHIPLWRKLRLGPTKSTRTVTSQPSPSTAAIEV